MIGFSIEPMPSTSQRTRSPGSRKTGGSRKTPTPDGVPVAITSPASSVMAAEMNAMSEGTSQIMSAVEASCIWCSSPSLVIRQLRRRTPPAGSISSAVTNTGPIGRNVSLPFARSHWPSPFSPSPSAAGVPCQSRALTSFTDDVAGDVRHRFLDRHSSRLFGDHDAELDLEIERVGPLWTDDRFPLCDDRVRELREDQGAIGTRAAAFSDVILVVQPDAHDLPGPGHRGCRRQLGRVRRYAVDDDPAIAIEGSLNHLLAEGPGSIREEPHRARRSARRGRRSGRLAWGDARARRRVA